MLTKPPQEPKSLRRLSFAALATFGGMLVVLLGTTAVGLNYFHRQKDAADMVERTYETLLKVDALVRELEEAESEERAYLITRADEYLPDFENAATQVPDLVQKVTTLTAGNPEQQERIGRIADLAGQRLKLLQNIVQEVRAGRGDVAFEHFRSGEGKRIMDQVEKLLAEMRQTETDLLETRSQRRADVRTTSQIMIYSALFVSIGLVMCGAVVNTLLARRRALLAAEVQRRAASEAELARSREQYKTTLASIGDAVIATDAKGRVSFMNAVAESMTGWHHTAAVGRDVHDVFQIFNEQTRARAENPIERVLATGMVVGLANHTILIGRSGAEYPIDDSGAPILNAVGETVGVVLVFRDVTERRRVEGERTALLAREQAARRQAENADRVKDEFLATLSHELRTPLNAILGWAVLLRNGLKPDEQRQAVETIERNGRLQAQLIEDLLDMSRIMQGKVRMETRWIALGDVARAALESVAPAAEARGVSLVSDLGAAGCETVGDPTRLQQVVWNLLTNAIKFTPRGGKVLTRLERMESHFNISVTDSGSGISPEFLPHVFDRFRQADSSTIRRHGGLGLGLAIVKQLVELHGGTVTAESAGEGQGARFIVSLPVPALRRMGGPESSSIGGDSAHPAISLNGLNVLVVDDDPDSLRLIAHVLEARGAAVGMAHSAEDALEQMDQRAPELLISDIGMPGTDGFDLIKKVRMRGEGRGARVPAIALTAFARPEDRRRAALSGFQTHLAKPVDPEELVAVVAGLAVRLEPQI